MKDKPEKPDKPKHTKHCTSGCVRWCPVYEAHLRRFGLQKDGPL